MNRKMIVLLLMTTLVVGANGYVVYASSIVLSADISQEDAKLINGMFNLMGFLFLASVATFVWWLLSKDRIKEELTNRYGGAVAMNALVPIILVGIALKGETGAISMDCSSNAVRLEQRISLKSVALFDIERYTASCDEFSEVVVSGPGGRNMASNYIISHLKKTGVHKSHAVGVCDSACTGIWASFPDRSLGKGAVLGFHRSQDDVGFESMHTLNVWYRSFPPEAVKAFATIGHEDVCRLKAVDVVRFGLVGGDYKPFTEQDVLDACIA